MKLNFPMMKLKRNLREAKSSRIRKERTEKMERSSQTKKLLKINKLKDSKAIKEMKVPKYLSTLLTSQLASNNQLNISSNLTTANPTNLGHSSSLSSISILTKPRTISKCHT